MITSSKTTHSGYLLPRLARKSSTWLSASIKLWLIVCSPLDNRSNYSNFSAVTINSPCCRGHLISSGWHYLRCDNQRGGQNFCDNRGKVVCTLLSGLKQISRPNKAETSFVSDEHASIVIQPLEKTERHRCTKRFQGISKGV